MRRWRVLILLAVFAVASASYAPSAGAATTLSSGTTATLRLSDGQTVTASGSLALSVQRFSVNDDSIVLVGQVSGTLAAGPVTATFTNVRVVAAITNLQANCEAGTLSFNFRATVVTRGISVTVDGISVRLRGAVTLRGSVAIATADIADEELRAAVGDLICQIDQLLEGGASLDDLVAALNAVLSQLA